MSEQVGLFDDTYVYLSPGKTSPWMFVVTSQDSDLRVLSEMPMNDSAGLRIDGFNHAWILVHHEPTGSAWRVTLHQTIVLAVPLDMPQGWWFLDDCYRRSLVLDGMGNVIVTSRNEAEARVWRVDPDSGDWESLGYPITETNEVAVKTHVGTIVIETNAPHDNFCPELQWSAGRQSTDALVGRTLQVVSWITPLLLPPDAGQLSMHYTGLCAAWTTADSDGSATLEIHDMGTGAVSMIPVAGTASWVK